MTEDVGFRARAGDEVAVESHRLAGGRRRGEILEVLGTPDHEYYRVRWQDGRETTFHPGPDAVLETKGRRPAPRRPRRPRRPAAPRPAPEPPERQPAHPRASPGDRLVIRGHHLGEPDRDAEILEVLGEDGGPPYRVRWSDTGRIGLLFPGTDAVVEHFPKRRARPVGPKGD